MPYHDPLAFERIELSNGVGVWLNLGFPLKAVVIGVMLHAGGREDPPGKEGLAHFMEHMPFRGTENFPTKAALASPIEDYGGDLNAWTSKEKIVFFAKVSSDDIPVAVRVLDELTGRARNDEADFEIERAVVAEEWESSLCDPSNCALEACQAHLFAGHPLAARAIGNRAALEAISVEDIRSFYGRHSRHGAFTLIAAGGAERYAVLSEIERYFGARRIVPVLRLLAEPAEAKPARIEIADRPYARTVLILGAQAFSERERVTESAAADLFARMLGEGLSSPLFEALREREGLVYGFNFDYVPYCDTGALYFGAATHYAKADRVADVFFETVERVSKDAARLETARRMTLKGYDVEEWKLSHVLHHAAGELMEGGRDPLSVAEEKAVLGRISMDDIRSFSERYMRRERFTTVIVKSQAE